MECNFFCLEIEYGRFRPVRHFLEKELRWKNVLFEYFDILGRNGMDFKEHQNVGREVQAE
jgi:hypothetical protein